MIQLKLNSDYLRTQLESLLKIPSPTGYTDTIVHYVGEELQKLGISFELTRRGAIRADLKGEQKNPGRAITVHLDTLGAMTKNLKDNGRLEVAPIGTWSARFAEGCRVTIFSDSQTFRGTLLPLKASGHTFNQEIDTQAIAWENLECRLDEKVQTKKDLIELGCNVGDFIAIDPVPEFSDNGYVNARHLDNKAGVATLLATAKAIRDKKITLPLDCHLLFTIAEEIGVGASSILHGDITEMVSIDNSTPAPGQNSMELGVTVAMMDSSGPFDYHLNQKLIGICQKFRIPFSRDVFKYYRCDAASAVEAGNDIRTTLLCFGLDASHGYERTHLDSLRALGELLALYMQSDPTFQRDQKEMGDLKGFPTQPTEDSSL